METIGKDDQLYLAVDVGGTKIQASLVKESGVILGRTKQPTPRPGGPEAILAAIEETLRESLQHDDEQIDPKRLRAIGIAIPGVVDSDSGLIVVTPNMNLGQVAIGPHFENVFQAPVSVGNDCNLGTLGEKWLGSARWAASAVGIFVGTGIGAGIVQGESLWNGSQNCAAEIGHIVMQIGGPLCGCGNRGCLEALASRTAMERDIREAVAAGRETMLTELLEGDLSLIRSGALKKALLAEDELVQDILGRAAEVLGHACLTVRHLLDPEVVVLGGGVCEACGEFVMPKVERIVADDKLMVSQPASTSPHPPVLLSALGDDAVVLGAVALARIDVGRSPFKKRFSTTLNYPKINMEQAGKMVVGRNSYKRDISIRVNGRVKKWKRPDELAPERIGREEVVKACQGGPEVFIVGVHDPDRVQLTEEARQFLRLRTIVHHVLSVDEAITAYNDSPKRKAGLFQLQSL